MAGGRSCWSNKVVESGTRIQLPETGTRIRLAEPATCIGLAESTTCVGGVGDDPLPRTP